MSRLRGDLSLLGEAVAEGRGQGAGREGERGVGVAEAGDNLLVQDVDEARDPVVGVGIKENEGSLKRMSLNPARVPAVPPF